MKQNNVKVLKWTENKPPDESSIRRLLADENLLPYLWSNSPGDIYAAHSHEYQKIIYVVAGSITFGLPDNDEEIILETGDRLELPAGVRHNAIVGPQGVSCLEAHRDE